MRAAVLYLIRRLNLASEVRDPRWAPRGFLASIHASVGAGFSEIDAREVTLSGDEVTERLASRHLRSTDLVKIGGLWTTLAESRPFAEVAAPFQRRERFLSGLLYASVLFALLSALFLEIFGAFLFSL